MNSTSSSTDQSKIKKYSALVSSSFVEMRKLLSNTDLPQILDKERSTAIQSTLNAQAEQIKNLQQENQILLSQQNNQQNNGENQFLTIFASKTNIFLENFAEFVKIFQDNEIDKINKIAEQINKYKIQIQQLNNFIHKPSNNLDLQMKDAQILQLQKDIRDLQAQNATFNSLNSQFTKTNNDLQNLLQNAENSNRNNSNLINQLNNQIIQKDELINSLKKQNQEKDERIVAFQKMQNSNQNQNFQSSNPEYEYSESFNFTMPDNNSAMTDAHTLKTIDSLNSQIGQLQNSLNEKDGLISNLNQMLKECQAEKQTLQLQIQQKDFEISGLKTNSVDIQSATLLKQKIEEMTTENQNKDNEINILKQKITISNYKDDQIKSLSSHVDSLANENTKLKEEVQKNQNSNKQFLEQIKNLQDSKSLLNNTNLDLNAKIDELEAKLIQLQSDAPKQTNEIQEMRERFEKNKEQDDQKINSLIKQLKDTLAHSERVKNELISVQQENAKLQNEIQTVRTSLQSIQFTNSLLEKKLSNSEELNNQKDNMIQHLNNSKDELNQQYEELIGKYNNIKRQFEQSNKNFSTILGCRPEVNDISKNLTSCFEKLAELQSSVIMNNDIKKEIALLRRQNDDLNDQMKKKEERLQSTLTKINLSNDGKESELVKKFYEDFTELNQEHSKLIEDHKQLQSQLFLSESSYKEIESKLIDQQKINEELSKKSEKLDLYEFVTTHFIEFLSSLSSTLISSLIQISSVHQKRLSTVDSLLVQLKKKHFSSDKTIAFWNSFCSVVQESLIFDPIESTNANANRIQYIINTKMNAINQKIADNQQKITQISKKSLFLKTQMPNSPLLPNSYKSPMQITGTPGKLKLSNKRKTPNTLIRTNPDARDSPSTVFETNIADFP